MKKIISAILLTLVFCLCFVSCDFSFNGFDVDGGEDSTTVMYGVCIHIGDLNQTCVFFPGIGHMTLPALASGEEKPEFDVDDLVKITFGKNVDDIPIMESFPGQFGAKAEEILVKKANIGFEITDSGILFSHDASDGLSLSCEDEITLSVIKENLTKAIGEGKVTETKDGRFSANIDIFGTEKEFLSLIFENELKISRE